MGTQLFGVGTVYSCDTLDLQGETYKYIVIDVAMLTSKFIDSMNKLFSRTRQVKADTMVIDPHPDGGDLIVSNLQFSYETDFLYSRLANDMQFTATYDMFSGAFPFLKNIKVINCSEFARLCLPGRTNCGVLWSDPNHCQKVKGGLMTEDKFRNIMNAYYGIPGQQIQLYDEDGNPGEVKSAEEVTLKEFKKLVQYESPTAPLETAFSKLSKLMKNPGKQCYDYLFAKQYAQKTETLFRSTSEILGSVRGGLKLKLKKKKKQKRPKITTARRLTHK